MPILKIEQNIKKINPIKNLPLVNCQIQQLNETVS